MTATKRKSAPREPAVRRLLPILPPLKLDLGSVVALQGVDRTAVAVNSVTGLEIELSFTNASTLKITIEDPDYALYLDRIFDAPIRLSLGQDDPQMRYIREWRLDLKRSIGSVDTEGTATILTFWSAGTAQLKSMTKPVRKSAGQMDFAAFVAFLARGASGDVTLLPVVTRARSAPPRESGADSEKSTSVGFSAEQAKKITIKGEPADREQLRNIDEILTQAVKDKTSARAVHGMVCANIGESSYKKDAKNPSSGARGIFQLLATTARDFGLDPNDLPACTHVFLKVGYTQGKNGKLGAHQLAAANPGLTPGDIASKVEGSDQGGKFYDVHRREAQQIIELWSGVVLSKWSQVTGPAGTSDDPTANDARPAEWRIGTSTKAESYWTGLGRTAEGLGQRRFESANRLVVGRDQDLILAAPHMTLRLNDPIFAERPRTRQDGNHTLTTISIRVFAEQWSAPPGAVVDWVEAGVLDGPWLVESVRARAGDEVADVVLAQPTTKIPKPSAASKDPATEDGPREPPQAAIRWAAQQIGAKEIGSNTGAAVSKIITDNGGTPGQPWCGYFCRGALRAAGLNPPVTMASVQWIYDTSGARQSVFKGRTTAKFGKPGDLVVLNGSGTHVGLVERVDVARGIVHTIEGNTSLKAGGEGVSRKERQFSSVTAIAQVRYSAPADEPAAPRQQPTLRRPIPGDG